MARQPDVQQSQIRPRRPAHSYPCAHTWSPQAPFGSVQSPSNQRWRRITMRIEGRWLQGADGVERPVLEGYLAAPSSGSSDRMQIYPSRDLVVSFTRVQSCFP